MLKFAKKEYPDAYFARMNLRKLGFRKAVFGGIYASYSFLHIPKKDAKPALIEFRNVMKPGGAIMLVLKEGRGEKPIGINAKPDVGIGHALWMLPEMNNLLRACGFKILFSERWMPVKKKPWWLVKLI
ncbi:MAG: class I SAM-dependent methyltransferase [Nanoarchaeota archaeon]|nr:class I SAM-dependent methyltransferase [Nanoarchaeota archaeon]MBU4300231.1 class I SAM-dependent methyltransferase [Nanoarchaeota archaeon]MBU4451617.1 class I SAM-dependent methyltransferase [Nanoarchaeota archaeon]MCG2723139.1 class I SAM-dependent methyltransferase [archaeon]